MTISERIAVNAKVYCGLIGKRISDLEKGIGVSVGYLSRVKGKAMMPIDKGYAIARWFGVSLDDLITGEAIKNCRLEKLYAEIARIEAPRRMRD